MSKKKNQDIAMAGETVAGSSVEAELKSVASSSQDRTVSSGEGVVGSTELAVQEDKKKVPARKKKEPKTFPKKKLPRMLKKKYSQKKFNRKI